MRDCRSTWSKKKTATHLHIDTHACKQSPKSFIKKGKKKYIKKLKHAQEFLDITDKLKAAKITGKMSGFII